MRFETWKIIITSVKKTKHNDKKERGLLAVFEDEKALTCVERVRSEVTPRVTRAGTAWN